jgi:hypothetical protein
MLIVVPSDLDMGQNLLHIFSYKFIKNTEVDRQLLLRVVGCQPQAANTSNPSAPDGLASYKPQGSPLAELGQSEVRFRARFELTSPVKSSLSQTMLKVARYRQKIDAPSEFGSSLTHTTATLPCPLTPQCIEQGRRAAPPYTRDRPTRILQAQLVVFKHKCIWTFRLSAKVEGWGT